jgi:putative transposase
MGSYLEASDSLWEIAKARERVIRVISKSTERGIRSSLVDAAAVELGLSRTWIYRLLKAYEDDPRTRSLLPKARGPKSGKSRIDQRVEAIIENEIQSYYLTRVRPTKAALMKGIHARCHKKGLKRPGRQTVEARLRKISKRDQTKHRVGAKRARNEFAPIRGALEAERPLQIVQIDHTPLDVMAVERESREVIGRPFITLAHDVRTRMYCGFYLSFDPPSAASVAACLSHAVADKARWLEDRHLRGSWPVSGLCEIIHVDNGKEFHSRAFTRACEDYGIEVRYRPPGTPHMGGHVERRIGHLAREIHLLDGTTFSNVKERGVYDSAGRACLTIAEIEWLVATIVLEHHAMLHSGIGTSPLAKWNSETEGRQARMPADMRAFYRDFLPFEERKLLRDGLHLFGIRYWHDALAPFLDNKESVVVHYDPSNLAKVYVRGRSGAYLEIPYRDLRSPPISKWELKAVTRAGRREGRRNVDESTIFEMVLARRKLLEEARSSSRRARRDLARGARLPPDSQLRIEGLNPDNQRDDESTDQDRPVELPYYDTEEWDE